MKKLKWTSEQPTETGFYWCEIEGEASIVEISEVYSKELDKNLLIIELIGDGNKYIFNEKFSSGFIWAGPIPRAGG